MTRSCSRQHWTSWTFIILAKRWRQLRHMMLMDDGTLPKLANSTKWKPGIPRKNWIDTIQQDLKWAGLTCKDVQQQQKLASKCSPMCLWHWLNEGQGQGHRAVLLKDRHFFCSASVCCCCSWVLVLLHKTTEKISSCDVLECFPRCGHKTQKQQRFTVSEMAADWHELIVLQCIVWFSSVIASFHTDVSYPTSVRVQPSRPTQPGHPSM